MYAIILKHTVLGSHSGSQPPGFVHTLAQTFFLDMSGGRDNITKIHAHLVYQACSRYHGQTSFSPPENPQNKVSQMALQRCNVNFSARFLG